uniref:Peptidase S1 domain-containing protein n=1 Tax=Romanomermis culicivorax TaxID=13658 RepID=A0A915L8X6_ROMCU
MAVSDVDDCGFDWEFRGYAIDRMDIRMGEEIGAHDTLIVSVIVEDYALDHMSTEHGLHCNGYWTMGVDNGAIGYFEFTTDLELEGLFVESGTVLENEGKQLLLNVAQLEIVLGKHDTWDYEITEQRYRVINTMVHDKYLTVMEARYDIGIIKLSRPVTFNAYIRAIPLTNVSISGVNMGLELY